MVEIPPIAKALQLSCLGCGGTSFLPLCSTDTAIQCADCQQTSRWHDGILLLNTKGKADDYDAEGYSLLVEVEPRHFWFRGRNRLILSTVRETVGELTGRSVLDIGCGTGSVLASLERAGMIGCGLDMHLTGLRYARRRVKGPLLCSSALQVPFVSQFDVVMLCDVIEHASDDVAILRAARQALKDRGVVVVTVPADPRLWTPMDEMAGHKRRYSKQSLTAVLQRANLQILFVRYFGLTLFPLLLLRRALYRHSPIVTSEERFCLRRRAWKIPPRPLNTLLHMLMTAEVALSRFPSSFGSSLIAVGRK